MEGQKTAVAADRSSAKKKDQKTAVAAPSPARRSKDSDSSSCKEKIRPPVAAKQEQTASSGDTSAVPHTDPFKLFAGHKLEEQDPYGLFGVKVEVKHELEIGLVASVDDAPHTQSSGSAHKVPPGPCEPKTKKLIEIPAITKRSIMQKMEKYQTKKKLLCRLW